MADVLTLAWTLINADITLRGIRVVTVLVFIGSLLCRIYVMNRNTQQWDALGYALRTENILYALL